jgi:tetratricopeptide (TPR) repeat protein
MNKAFYIVIYIFLFFLASCNSGKRAGQMNRILTEADSLDHNYIRIDTLKNIEQACDYFIENGNREDKTNAFYIKGAMYRDKGDAPRALDNFQNSISLIDTTECDSSAYAFLSKVYAETAMILYNQGLYSNALANISHAIDYASLSGDTLRMLSYEAQIPSIYSEQKKYSKAITEALKMYHRYLNFNRPAEANTCLVSVFVSLMNMGKYHEAKKYIDTYIANSLFTGKQRIL